jgi:hypothetical protein
MFYYGQIIEYVDGTRDLNFENARQWCNENNAHFLEIEPKEDGTRQFKIVELTLAEMQEEVRLTRASLYIAKVDPITSHINRLRDEELTPELAAEIAKLVEERKAKVEEIKARYPYPDEPIEEIEELPVAEESSATISEMETVDIVD